MRYAVIPESTLVAIGVNPAHRARYNAGLAITEKTLRYSQAPGDTVEEKAANLNITLMTEDEWREYVKQQNNK